MARSTISQEEMFQIMNKHFKEHGSAHECVDVPTRYECDMCGMPGFGRRRFCRLCNMTYHPYCEISPAKPPCFLHPGQHDMSSRIVTSGSFECAICCKWIVGLCYSCDPINWRVHPICFLLRQLGAADGGEGVKEVAHFSHPQHSLKEIYMKSAYQCNGCGTRGFGRRFRCRDCDFDLHHYCAVAPQRQPCCLHTGHEMAQMIVKRGSFECYLCPDPITSTDAGVVGLHYECEASKLNAHPLCVMLQQLQSTGASSSTRSGEAAAGRRRRRLRKRDLIFKLARTVFLHCVGVPDFAGVADVLDVITTLWDSALSIRDE